jgi:competence protein ComEA
MNVSDVSWPIETEGFLGSIKIRLFSWWVKVMANPWHFGALGLAGVGLLTTGLCWWRLTQSFQAVSQQLAQVAEVAARPTEQVAATAISQTPQATKSASQSGQLIKVHLAGAVRKPGVYSLPLNSLVTEAIAAAGGLSGLVWQDYVDQYLNLAEIVTDHQKIWIPTQEQQNLFLVSQSDAAAEQVVDNSAEPAIDSSTDLISINTASLAELDSLAGIGQKRAEDIIANRPYQTIEELTAKAKVPASMVAAFRAQITL